MVPHDVGMGYLLYAPYVQFHKELLMALMERWSENNNTFHLPIGEVTIVPKDVYRILHVHLKGCPIFIEENIINA